MGGGGVRAMVMCTLTCIQQSNSSSFKHVCMSTVVLVVTCQVYFDKSGLELHTPREMQGVGQISIGGRTKKIPAFLNETCYASPSLPLSEESSVIEKFQLDSTIRFGVGWKSHTGIPPTHMGRGEEKYD